MTDHHRTPEWKRVQRMMRPRIAAALPTPCVEGCGHDVQPGTPFDLAHVVSVHEARKRGWTPAQTNDPSNIGPAHTSCNRSAGGKVGAIAGRAANRAARRLPNW